MEAHQPTHAAALRLVDDCWIEIFRRLPAGEVVRARRVSKQLHKVLTDSEVSRRLLQLMFPQCREVRLDMLQHRLDDLPDMPHNLRVEVECRAQQNKDWSEIFAAVARRYHYLESGTPRDYLKLPMPELVDHTTPDDCICMGYGDGDRGICTNCRFKVAQCSQFFWMNVPVWSRMFKFHEDSQEFHFPDPMWWYSQEDGLLVYPAGWSLGEKGSPSVKWTEIRSNHSSDGDGSFRQSFAPSPDPCTDFFYRLFDPETNDHVSVPFDVRGKIIRRVRLAQGVLIFEWTQVSTDNTPIDGDKVSKRMEYKAWAQHYRRTWAEYLVRNAHMVTAYDVVRTPLIHDMDGQGRRPWIWTIRLRHEWKLPHRGSGSPREDQTVHQWDYEDEEDSEDDDEPVRYGSVHDYRPRFFSAHTATHYALFIWKQEGDVGRDKVRQLFVWNMSEPERHGSPNLPRKKAKRTGPTLVRRLGDNDMRHYLDIIAEAEWYPTVRNIAMDEHNVYLVHDDHHWAPFDFYRSSVGSHAVLSQGIPVIPFPSANKSCSSPTADSRKQANKPVLGPQWLCQCPCGRGSGFFIQDEEPLDPDTDTEDFFSSVFCQNFVHAHQGSARPRSSPVVAHPPYSCLRKALLPAEGNPSYPWNGSDAASQPLQPRNYPGFPPCWRHENFPYIGISAVTDYAAGVRWVARDSRPLNLLTHLLRPTVTVNISGSRRLTEHTAGIQDVRGQDHPGDGDDDGGPDPKWHRPRAAVINPAEPPPPARGPMTLDERLDRFHLETVDTGSAYHENDFDPLIGDLEELRHPFKFEPEPRNIREDEVEVRCSSFWENMMGRMTLAGDERWLIGQDGENRITLVRF